MVGFAYARLRAFVLRLEHPAEDSCAAQLDLLTKSDCDQSWLCRSPIT